LTYFFSNVKFVGDERNNEYDDLDWILMNYLEE